MMRRFDEQLTELNDKLLDMGALVERLITMASQALIEQDTELAKTVLETESDVKQREKDIEALCLKLLMQHQPVASDLRLISAALKMITDIERIGDQAADISEIVIMMNGAPYITKSEYFPQMAAATIKMVTESIDAYVKKDLRLAKSVIKYDDVVDELFDKVKHDLMELIRRNAPNSEQAIDLLMIAKYFERIGDHARNVAKWVVFSIRGRKIKPKSE
ncbi:MAG: phosphate signaling complex protein PhoU [Defluviitaleaceae bacterium]|nr:phosphate signaling complex protein PhoU [Defluviitaleaceae bacterium]